MPRKPSKPKIAKTADAPAARPSSLVDTRIIYCGDCLDQLRKLPIPARRDVDLIYISQIRRGGDPPFNSNRNYEVFRCGRSEPLAEASGPLLPFEDRHTGTQAYIDYMRPRCVELTPVLKETVSQHCYRDYDWRPPTHLWIMAQPLFEKCTRDG